MKKITILLISILFINFTIAQNLVTNGNFSLGNTSFTTGYILDCTVGGAIGAERYCVGTNPNAVHTAWSACGDHTTGTGNMMILNGTPTPNVIVWEQGSIAVTPNTCYKFCVWATSVYPDNPAKIKLKVNGATQNFVSLTPTTCAWQQICGIWNSGPATSATLTILDEDVNPGGNDLAIDDISFVPETTPCTITLPLTWRYVKAFSQASNNVVEWAVDNDINNSNFIIEKSINGIEFDAIENIPKNISNIYAYSDKNYSNIGTTYYRIKQVDLDGKYAYSSIVKVNNNNRNKKITILENPVTDFIKLKINAKTGNYDLQIFNVTGSKVYSEKIILQNNYLEKILPSSNLISGMYFILLTNENNENIAQEKFLKK